MRQKLRKFFVLALAGIMCIMTVSCNGFGQKTQEENQKEYKIVLLGKESYVYSDQGFIKGMELALEQVQAQGIALTFEHVDDKGEYEQGVLVGGELAKDPSVLAVFTFQDFEIIEALASVFEEAKKPLVSVQGCYETTLQAGYDCFISAFTSAGDMGKAIADYCAESGIERVACSHTGTEFEREEMRGFERQARENGVTVVDMLQGPNTMTDLKSTYYRWEKLQVDAVYMAHLTYSDTEWMLEMITYLKEQNPDLKILSDYSLNNEETLKKYGDVLEGVVITAPYSVAESQEEKEFRKQFEEIYGFEASNVAIQGYDLVQIMAELLKEGINPKDFAEQLKRKEGFAGITGQICFEEDGRLTGITPQFLVVKNRHFVEFSGK